MEIEKEDNEKIEEIKRILGKKNEFNKVIVEFFGKKDLAKKILKIQPLYYDEAKMWWIWDTEKKYWKIVDETDILNLVDFLAVYNTTNSKEKTEILEALRQEARKNKPLPSKPTWVQFNNVVFDVMTGERFFPSPKYFICNRIPYNLHPLNYELTPTIDRIFEEWVGKEYVKTLYQIIAYCMLPDYPIHRLFCFVGSGMNGKSCFLNLLKKAIGTENCTSTELDILLNSRFEITKLHKKLVCLMGETNFNEIKNTSILKKLTGGDLIGFEYKNKMPFEDVNYAKIIISTNNLPTTLDKTIGFYRRWLIIEFPNQFSEEKDILAEIPEEEYQSLVLKCVGMLKDLLKERRFWNEGSVEERIEKYESKSNFLEKFVKNFLEEDTESYITVSEFNRRFLSWCKENRHREMSETSIGIAMKKLGFEQIRKRLDWLYDGRGGQARVWLGVKWKEEITQK